MLQEGKLATIKGETYIVMSIIAYIDNTYAFTTKLNEQYEPTEDNYIWLVREQKIELITDQALIIKLLPIFQTEIRKKILKGDIL